MSWQNKVKREELKLPIVRLLKELVKEDYLRKKGIIK